LILTVSQSVNIHVCVHIVIKQYKSMQLGFENVSQFLCVPAYHYVKMSLCCRTGMSVVGYVHIPVNSCVNKSLFYIFSIYINVNQTPMLSVITSFKSLCQLSRCLICANGHLSHRVVSQFFSLNSEKQ